MKFFKTVISACSGPSAFPNLMTYPPQRALLHLFLLCLLLAVVISGFKVVDMEHSRRIIAGAFTDYFGAVVMEKDRIVPQRNAGRARTFLLSPEFRFDYLTRESLKKLDGMDDWKELAGVFWCPRGFVLWTRKVNESGIYLLTPLPPPVEWSYLLFLPMGFASSQILTPGECRAYLLENYFPGGKKETPLFRGTVVRTPGEISSMVLKVLSVSFFFSAFFGIFLLSLIVSLLFAVMQYIFVPKVDVRLKFGPLLSVMIYASFPALVIASASLIVELPFFSFQTVFFVVFFIYQMLAFGAVQRFLNPPPPRNDGEDDQDFF